MQSAAAAAHTHGDDRLQFIELVLGHIHDVGVVLVEFVLADTALQLVTHIEFQRLHHASADVGAGQNLQLIVEAIGVGYHSHALESHLPASVHA